MVMSTASMAMSGMTPTATGMGHMPSSTAKPMGGMGGMGMGGGCKISVSSWILRLCDAEAVN